MLVLKRTSTPAAKVCLVFGASACLLLILATYSTLAIGVRRHSDNQASPTAGTTLHKRAKRALYELSDGAELVVGPNIRTSFTCDGLGYGYYADLDNECKIFHVCQSFRMSDGSIYNNHWSFFCPNQTLFNQVSLSCSHPEDSIPCENAKEFYHVNDYFGELNAPSVKESDLSTAHELVARAYGSRLSSPQ